MEFLETDYDRIYGEVKKRALEEGAYTLDGWKTVIDDVIDTHEEFGELDEGEEQTLRDVLVDRFEDFSSELPEA